MGPVRRRRTGALLLVAVLAAGLLVGLAARSRVVQLLTVSSTSMSPTLCPGDRIVVALWRSEVGDVGRGDLVAVRVAGQDGPLVKRVVGVPGDRVAIRDAYLYVNGERVTEPYVDHETIDSLYYGPVVVPGHRLVVMGDNRELSVDSRRFGPVPEADLLGRVVATLGTGRC